MVLSMLFALIYALLAQNKLGLCKSCLPATTIPPFTGGEGYGGVIIGPDEIPSYGITTIQGVIPVSGEVGFSGPIHGTGTVSIVAKCGPARSCFLPTLLKPRRSTPVAPVSPAKPVIPDVEIPVVRATRIEKVVPAVEVVKETPIVGKTRIEVVPNVEVVGEIPVAGTTRVEGAIPTIGEVAFNGVVPAKGTVMIIGSCCY